MKTENEHHDLKFLIPEARYAYYRRCQEFKKNGEQCKAPAEKGAHICHAHAGQRELALRREREQRAVLEEVVRRMRRRGKPDFQMADIFMDFNAIQVTLAVMAQAVIDGRMDCKTAGRMAVVVQMSAKLLAMIYRKGREGRNRKSTTEARRHGGEQISPLINADDADRGQEELQEPPQIYAGERRVPLKIDVNSVKADVETNINSGRSIKAA
jgi:hypothetical protein